MPARITRAAEAPPYAPPLHDGVIARRLQGHEAGPTERFWVGHSVYPPGSAAQTSPTAAETVYVCLGGQLDLTVEEDGAPTTHTLHAGDSVHMPAGTIRSVVNASGAEAQLLVVIATPRAG